MIIFNEFEWKIQILALKLGIFVIFQLYYILFDV